MEDYPEPTILLFDLDRISHRENITWAAGHSGSFVKDYEPPPTAENVDAFLAIKATNTGDELDVPNSVVDLMKALGLDSSLGTRRELALIWGYTGPLVGSAEMNTFIHRRLMKRYIDAGGKVSDAVKREAEEALKTSGN